MATGDQTKIEGPFSKSYELWRVDKMKVRIERLAAADSLDGLSHVTRRLDWLYQIYHNGKPFTQTTSTP